MFFGKKELSIPTAEDALPGREQTMRVPESHFVNGNTLTPPFPEHLSKAIFGLGCFWGAEKKFWMQQGVYSTAVGYAAGFTKNPTYQEVCSGMTGHNEVVLVVFDEAVCRYESLVKLFFENHNPTQGMQQGNDKGTQYRSGVYTFSAQQAEIAEAVKKQYQVLLSNKNAAQITTEIILATEFYYAEDYHQQYLAKNPNGYCGLGGTGITFG
ncbi:Peptide-methionine (S)-S-oxide reductase MsrA [hydrothermal vent metagenome]|uniref:peptide-methionine (S)-S-oxide reductase n=1 Tax=hydrothermal vent metagenome TaxID=652676 RepID=A0A3B0X9A0_9ZZZZ